MQTQLAGYVSGLGKGFTIFFNPDRLERVLKKYGDQGATLTVLTGVTTLQPAPPALSKPATWPEPIGPAKPKKQPTVRSSKPKTSRYQRVLNPKLNARIRPIVCITTGQYYPSMKDAAAACGGHRSAISNQINKIGKVKSCKGLVHRFATVEEIEAKRML